MNNQHQEALPALKGWRFEIVSDGDVRAYDNHGESWLLRAKPGEGTFEDFAHRLVYALASTPPAPTGWQPPVGSPSAMLDEAERLCKDKGYASISYVQRKMKIGYAKATELVEELRATGRIGSPPPAEVSNG